MTEEIKKEKNVYTVNQMKKILQTAEMALWLDGYDDMFSDFDPRGYGERSLSDDFLLEMKKMVRDRGRDSFELKFLLSPGVRNYNDEMTIKERLHHFFSEQNKYYVKKKTKIIVRGLVFITLGVLLMGAASLMITFYGGRSPLINLLVVLMEPGGWFLFWEGLNRAMSQTHDVNKEINFYHKMAHSRIIFLSY